MNDYRELEERLRDYESVQAMNGSRIFGTSAAAIRALREENERLAKDAARLDWLETNLSPVKGVFFTGSIVKRRLCFNYLEGEDFVPCHSVREAIDKAIDTALSLTASKEGGV